MKMILKDYLKILLMNLKEHIYQVFKRSSKNCKNINKNSLFDIKRINDENENIIGFLKKKIKEYYFLQIV